MKYVFILILSVFLLSCGDKKPEMSVSKKTAIEFALDLRDIEVERRFANDSISEETRYRITLIKLDLPQDTIDLYSKIHMDVFPHKWETPYDINKDRNLTFEKYIDFCKANNLEADKYYEFLK